MNDRPKMNQRLSAIKQQAHLYALDQEWYVDSFEQRFAELIVRECADACYKHKDVESFGIYPIRVAMVTKACSDNIKQHFGVEE